MKKDIFTLLNMVSTDVSAYEKKEVTEEELDRYKRSIKRRIGKKRSQRTCTILAVAACLLLVLTVAYFRPMQEKMRASSEKVTYSLSSMLGVPSGLEDHVLHVGESKRLGNATVRLNTVAADRGQLVVYTTVVYDDALTVPKYSYGQWERKYDEVFEETKGMVLLAEAQNKDDQSFEIQYTGREIKPFIQKIYLNEKELKCTVVSDLKANQGGVLQDVAHYNLAMEELMFPLRVRIEILEDVKQKVPEATFEVTLTEENVIADIKTVPLEQNVVLPNDDAITFSEFQYTPLGMRIYANHKTGRKEETIQTTLRAQDYKGREQNFREIPLSENESVFAAEDNSMFLMVPNMEEWECDISVWQEEEGKAKRYEMKDVLNIPLQ